MHKAFQVTAEDVERSSTLEESDIDRWAVMVNGCYQFCENKETAEDLAYMLNYDEEITR
jgi:hypothetical protein